MPSGQSDQTRYLTAYHDDKGKNVKLVKEWQREGLLSDCQITTSKIKISFKNRQNVQKAKTLLGIKPRNNRRNPGGGGGGKQRGSSNANDLIR